MKALLRLKPYLRPHLSLILISAFMAIPLSALRSAPALLVKYVVDDLLVGKNQGRLLWFPFIVIALFSVNFVVRFVHYYLLRIVIVRVSQKLKNELFEHIMGLSADYFTSQSTGSLISRVASDTIYVDIGVSCINTIIREPITFFFLVGYTLWLNWKLTLVTVIIFPPLAYVFSATGRNLKRYMVRITDENAKQFSVLQESFTGVRVIQTFRLEKYIRKKFKERTESLMKVLLKTSLLEEISHPMVELLTAFALAAVIYYGGSQVLQGKMTAGDLQSFFVAFALMMNPLKNLNELNIKLNQASAATARIFEIFDWKTRLHEPEKPRAIRGFEREISLESVEFHYPDAPQRAVLNKVSFKVPRGKIVALVGPSGAGKSSLASLLPRIFDITGGAIRIDGHDIRDLALDDLRRLIAVVSQDVFLFNDTIEENIRCGRLSATREEIREAARKAHALDFIEAAPQGFQSVIGDRGQKLSGGERQRISIARAFLREAPILVLDEATSSLDTKSERAVQEALDELMQNRTTLVIAHRLSTIKHADEIIVLKDGEIVERGTHTQLIGLKGEYAHLNEVGRV